MPLQHNVLSRYCSSIRATGGLETMIDGPGTPATEVLYSLGSENEAHNLDLSYTEAKRLTTSQTWQLRQNKPYNSLCFAVLF
jgi:hypothetical protein